LTESRGDQAEPARRSPLARAGWRYIAAPNLDSLSAAEWRLLEQQRAPYHAACQADTVLRQFAALESEPSFGYEINMFRHGLQTATIAHEAALDEETVVVVRSVPGQPRGGCGGAPGALHFGG
jgi:hypothetical protein